MEIQDKIDMYLMGRMSHEQKVAFEQDLKSDSELLQEVNLQKDIIKAIQQTKRLEMKQRLSSIDVNASSSFNFKPWVIGFSLTSLSVLGAWGIWNLTTSETITPIQPIQKNEIVSNTNTTSSTNEIITPIVEEESNTVIIEEVTVDKKVISQTTSKKKKTISDPTAFLPKTGSDDSEGIVHAKHEKETENSLGNNEDVHLKENLIPTIKKDKDMFHYQYDGEQLTLIGDFESDKPYTLYELQHEKGNPLFLLFQNRFYSIKNTGGKIQKLELVTDKKILSELKSK